MKEKTYPVGHNWEGLTVKQVNEAYDKYEEKTLSDDQVLCIECGTNYPEEDLKQTIKRLNEEELILKDNLRKITMSNIVRNNLQLTSVVINEVLIFIEKRNKIFGEKLT